MLFGNFTIEPLNEGQFELFPDGKINRTPVSEIAEQQSAITGNRSLAGVNPLYLTDGTRHILLDAGLGWGLDAGSINKDVSNICTNLDIFGVKATDITHIVLSHLHYDHAAGISYTDAEARTRPVFPNASCFVQQSEWDYAVRQTRQDPFYKLDDVYRLYADSFFELIDQDEKEIIPGITLLKTGGHTLGHQVVKISDDEKTAYYLGDLVPSPAQLNHFEPAARHTGRTLTKKMKIQLLRKAYCENALLYFYHSLSAKPGQLAVDEDQKFVFKEI